MAVEALSWPFEWGKLSRLDRFLLGVPFIGAQAKAKRPLNARLARRTPACLELWGARRADAEKFSRVLARELAWPNALFIPEDPFDILCWDAGAYAVDDLRVDAVLMDLEKAAGRVLPDDEAESPLKKRFGEVVDILSPLG